MVSIIQVEVHVKRGRKKNVPFAAGSGKCSLYSNIRKRPRCQTGAFMN